MSRTGTIGSHKTVVFSDDEYTNVVYHSTVVVRFNSQHIILNSGGWETVTTKARMNQTANQFRLGFGVYQKSHCWFVDVGEQTYEFYDGMKIDRKTGGLVGDNAR